MKKLLLALCLFCFSLCEGQSWDWGKQAKNLISSTGNWEQGIAVDTLGTTIMAGNYRNGQISFGSVILPEENVYLVKYDTSGNVLWGRTDSLPNNPGSYNFCCGVAEDNIGNSFITGYFIYSDYFGSNYLSTPGEDMYLVKYNPNGVVLWAKEGTIFHRTSACGGTAICADRVGNCYLIGDFDDTVIIGSFKMIPQRSSNSYVAKFDQNGNVLWVISIHCLTFNSLFTEKAITTDNKGYIYETGSFSDTVSIGNDTLRGGKNGNLFIAKYDSNGNVLWVKYSRMDYASGNSLSTDNADNIYVTGDITDTVIFNTDTLFSSLGTTVLLVKYDQNGNVRWAKNGGLPSSNGFSISGFSVATDKSCHPYISGRFIDTISFGSLMLYSDSIYPDFLVKFDSSGKPICGTVINNDGQGTPQSIAIKPQSSMVYFGSTNGFENIVVFGSDTVVGIETSFLSKWQPCNDEAGIQQIRSTTNLINLFPNPTTGSFTLSLSNVNEKCNVEIYNVLGESLYIATLKQVQGDNLIDLTSQPNGIYLYRVLKEDGSLVGSGKVVIEK